MDGNNKINPEKSDLTDEHRFRSGSGSGTPKFGFYEILAVVWIFAAILLSFMATRILQGSFPIFTFMMLITILVILFWKRDAAQIGIRAIPFIDLAKYSLISLGGSLLLMAILEPWSHTYRMLLGQALSSTHPDTTFGWLVRFPGPGGWAAFIFYAGLVTLFAEELFFRGWVLNWLKDKMSEWKAITVQAILFSIPQLLAAFLLPPTQGIIYAVMYSWLAIGLIGGWAASRTRSIWPSLLSATIYNLIMTVLSL